MDRRMSVKWVLAAAAAGVLSGAPPVRAAITMAQGYGTDPNLTKSYRPGDLWPLTLTRFRASDRRRSVRSDRSQRMHTPQCFSGGGGRLFWTIG